MAPLMMLNKLIVEVNPLLLTLWLGFVCCSIRKDFAMRLVNLDHRDRQGGWISSNDRKLSGPCLRDFGAGKGGIDIREG